MRKKTFNDEIDLADIILNIWDNKIKIIIITTVFIILGFLYFFNSSNKNLIARTNIKPISTLENQKYELFNNFRKDTINNKDTSNNTVIDIDSKSLLDLFISKIRTKEIIKNGIVKFKLIDKDNFQKEEDYKEAIEKTAISIVDNIQSPQIDSKNKNKSISYWTINFEINNKKNWKNFLKYLENQANEEVRQFLINQINTKIEIINFSTKFNLEDINRNITNAMEDYEISVTNRLAFLKEQAEIARALSIEKNTLETESFQTDKTIITNIKSENSYYLKGYDMIEKEISLIKSRSKENLNPFVPNLTELEKKKRDILQDNRIDRLKLLFSATPINSKENFIAARIDYVASNYFELEKSLIKILGISALIGFLTSIIYIFLAKIISSRR